MIEQLESVAEMGSLLGRPRKVATQIATGRRGMALDRKGSAVRCGLEISNETLGNGIAKYALGRRN